ncbi:unnamed protein product [Auanema sp. JU1783]|nr:unnamed protein product [Auanema sp. JU1783]
MQVTTANDVKIYNLSYGKNIPEWMTGQARRKLEKGNLDVRRRIELIQNFEMPDMSSTISITKDGRHVFASGIYKPFVKCFDLNDLSLKFERGVDFSVLKLVNFSDDYSKFAILQDFRRVEIHAAFGRYYAFRTPTQSRDFAFSEECSDLYFVGKNDQIYRLNLEMGEWLQPLTSNSGAINCCKFAPEHQLFVCGTTDGTVETYDHRDKKMVGLLDCQPHLFKQTDGKLSEITSVAFKDALHMAVGSSTGQIILYDIRSSRPMLIKDHYNELPIVKVEYVKREEGDLVLSMDSRVLKMWNEKDGSAFAAIESHYELTDFCRQPDTGLMFFANDSPKMLQYFVPAIGPAPRWCSFLEGLTEELEESDEVIVYDDFRFVTQQQLEDVGLSHLVGSNVLRAYMHGYFIHAKLYDKACTVTQPFAFKNYKERKIREVLDKERERRAVEKKVKGPQVNKAYVDHIEERRNRDGKKNEEVYNSVLSDDRFKQLFESKDYEVDFDSEIYHKKYGKAGNKKRKADSSDEEDDRDRMELHLPDDDDVQVGKNGADSLLESEEEDEETVSEKVLKKKQKQERIIEKRRKQKEKYLETKKQAKAEKVLRQQNKPKKFVLHDVDNADTSRQFIEEDVIQDDKAEVVMFKRKLKALRKNQNEEVVENNFGGKSLTFTLPKSGKAGQSEQQKEERKKHQTERKDVVRATVDSVSKNLKRLPRNIGKNQRF